MNDYVYGALEALAWVLGLIEDSDDVGRVRRQVERARDDLLRFSWEIVSPRGTVSFWC